MDTALNGNGEFELDGRGMPYLLSGLSEIMQRVSLCLKIKKGSFPYDRELGSELHTLTESVQPLGETAALLVKEAAAQIPQVKILDVEASFDSEKKLGLSVLLEFGGEQGRLEMKI